MIDGYKWYVNPNILFESEWHGWGPFLGSGPPRRVKRKLEEIVRDAERVAFDQGGVLPRRAWMLKNGYSYIACAMQRHPLRFDHIMRAANAIHTDVATWVSIAISIAREHGGVLPCHSWLRRNGYGSLSIYAIRRHPDLFSGIRIERRNARGEVISMHEATYDADDPTRPKGAKITKKPTKKINMSRDLEAMA